MAFFNFGKKDQYGKQRRIEHRGKNLRISRTGGVALRTQAKAAGLTVTANSKHGLRVSKGLSKGTQVALQNGRFVLRGRYGRGPTRLNLSKTGMSVSTRNPIGTFNWIKPNRSSVKIAGLQLRGKKAANIQLLYMLFMLIAQGLQLCGRMLSFIFRGTGSLLVGLFSWIASLPQRFNDALERRRNSKIASYLGRTEHLFEPPINQWTASELQAALLLVLCGWGRGLTAQETAVRLEQRAQQQVKTSDSAPILNVTVSELNKVAQRLEYLRTKNEGQVFAEPQAVTALLAQQFALTFSPEDCAEALLNADDWIVALDERTALQEQLVKIFMHFAQLRFEIAEPQMPESNEHSRFDDADSLSTAALRRTSQHAFANNSAAQNDLINLNTASVEQLQTLPHIGFERALDILALRPITQISQLTAIKGIGPARLADIKQAGIVL